MQGFKEVAQPWYTDQILPFDITIAAANEYGAAASAKLYGVEILNEGFGTSVDDSVLEQQATFIARSISPLQAIGRLLREKEEGRNTRGHRCAEAKTDLAREPVSRTWRLAEPGFLIGADGPPDQERFYPRSSSRKTRGDTPRGEPDYG